MDLPKLRKLLSLDPNDPLSHFALGKKLFEEGPAESDWIEAAEHLIFANTHAPDHLATYHFLAQALIRLNRKDEARPILEEGIRRSSHIAHGMGRDLAPAMSALLAIL